MRIVLGLLLVAAGLCGPGQSPVAHAQAWVPGPGQGTATVSYQFTRVKKHFFSENIEGLILDPSLPYVGGPGNSIYVGDIFGQNVSVGAEYGILPGLAATAQVVYASGRYDGLFPESTIDDNRYHGALQDLFLSLRHMTRWSGFAVTPVVSARIPTHDYDTIGHAAVGRGLNELSLGLYAGRSLEPWLPSVFAQAGYTRDFVENLNVEGEDLKLDRNRIAVDAGVLVTPAITVGGSYGFENMVDGLDWLHDVHGGNFHAHDRAAKVVAHRVGGFASWYGLGAVGLSLGFQAIVAGENTHDAKSVTFSTVYRFRGPSF